MKTISDPERAVGKRRAGGIYSMTAYVGGVWLLLFVVGVVIVVVAVVRKDRKGRMDSNSN